MKCEEQGIKQIDVYWAEQRPGFPALFEILIIDWSKEASVSAVARQLDTRWDAIDGIMQQRDVARGLKRRDETGLYPDLDVNETAFRKRHDYVTVVSDPGTGAVIHPSDDRKTPLGAFSKLCNCTLKTAWAWKEAAAYPRQYRSRTWAIKAWNRWYAGASRSCLEPVKKAARMIKKHLWGIVNAIVAGTTNTGAESINSRIKLVKARSRGFRNKDRFKTATYCHLRGLHLYPDSALE